MTREEFLARITRETARSTGPVAAGPASGPRDPATAAAAVQAEARRRTEPLLARFRTEAERLGVGVHRTSSIAEAGELVVGLATAREVRRVATWGRRTLGLISAVAVALRKAGLDVVEASPEDVTDALRGELRERLAAADLGLTGADLAIAETGTLVLASGTGKGRGVSLLPPCHVALFGRDQLVASLEDAGVVLEAWQAAPAREMGASVVLVTGPSRTADIELTLTRGVHGPREVHAVFVDSL